MSKRTHSLRGLLVWGILALLFLTTLLVAGCLYLTSKLSTTVADAHATLQTQLTLSGVRSDLLQMETQERGYWLTGKLELLGDHDQVLQRLGRLVSEELRIGLEPEQVRDAEDLKKHVLDRIELSRRMVILFRTGREREVRALVDSGQPRKSVDTIEDLISSMEARERDTLTGRNQQLERYKQALTFLLGVGLVGCLTMGVAILYRLSRRLEPLADCANLADKIGKGDLSLQPLPVRVEDEVGLLTLRLNEMLENLRLLTVQNRGAAEKLGSATRTILAAARDQAVYVQQQAAAVQETSATMEELGQSANHISERARDVVARAEATSKASELGLQAVEDNVRSTASTLEQVRVVASRILSLSEKTQAIGDIVSTVNDLSERSNVLALNAAILAAASPEGKTFSVVANEMKSLAEQSKDATTQVRGLLGDIERGIQACVFLTEEAVKRGEAGSVYTDQVNATITNLAGSIQESLLAFQQIVAATEQQRTASEHVNNALWSIRQSSDQTAMGTQKFEASARELHELSQALVATMERYRLRHETS